MNEEQASVEWGFALGWVVSCATGIVLFGLAAYWLRWRLGEVVGEAVDLPISPPVVVPVAGAVFAGLLALGGVLGPALLLRRIGISPARWIGYSTAAAAVTMSIGVSLVDNFAKGIGSTAVSALFVGSMLGMPMGLVQWLLLKQQAIPATIWPLISFAAYVLGIGIAFADLMVPTWLTLIGMGLVVGSITGLAMTWLLRRASEFPGLFGTAGP